MERIKTDRWFKGEFMCMWFVMCSILGVAFCHACNISGIAMFKIAVLMCGIANIAPLIFFAGIWAISNKLY